LSLVAPAGAAAAAGTIGTLSHHRLPEPRSSSGRADAVW